MRLVGIVLSLFSLGRHVPHIRGLETQYTRLGFGGYWGNKGGHTELAASSQIIPLLIALRAAE